MSEKESEASETRMKANVIVEGVIDPACSANHGRAEEDSAGRGMKRWAI